MCGTGSRLNRPLSSVVTLIRNPGPLTVTLAPATGAEPSETLPERALPAWPALRSGTATAKIKPTRDAKKFDINFHAHVQLACQLPIRRKKLTLNDPKSEL